MPKILSLSQRPKTLSGLYGLESIVKAIRNHVAKRPPSAWMFFGPSGTGKTTIASILSVAYQCSHMTLWGDPCKACWEKKGEFAIHEINASEVSGIEELKQIVDLARYHPVGEHGKRVIILDEAQRISNAAQNMLLAPFENAPASTIWIICTTEPGKILLTLRRRCVIYQLKSLGISAAERFLIDQARKVGITRPLPPLFEQCHLMQVGAPAMLLQALEKYAAGASAQEATVGAETPGLDSLRICKAVTSGDWKTVRDNLKEAAPDDARWIRASVTGWLRGILARETNSKGQEMAATSLLELCSSPLDDAVLLLWLWGALFRVTHRYATLRRV